MNLFTHRDLWVYLKNPSKIPAVPYEHEQRKFSAFVNSDSIFTEEPGFKKVETLFKVSMIPRDDYRLFSYVEQQCDRTSKVMRKKVA
jgi:hypothetical protein